MNLKLIAQLPTQTSESHIHFIRKVDRTNYFFLNCADQEVCYV